MKAQTIQIDSIFTSDGEIFPFSPNDTIYGLSISGSVVLHSDTSLVRVILTDNAGNEWMVYEAYPMIVTDTAFAIEEECDETCFLNKSKPVSIAVQITNATFQIDNFKISDIIYDDLDSLQYQSKRNYDIRKLDNIRQFILDNSLGWQAGDNAFLANYYQEKSNSFGFSKYNVQGYDYYLSGSFRFLDCGYYIQNSGLLPREFDWRSKHDANVPGTPYYLSTAGWLTPLRSQHTCGSCWVFAAVATVEAVTNMYFNQHCDYDLAEKDVLCCAIGNGCSGGDPDYAHIRLHNQGTFNEENYPYLSPYYYEGCCNQDLGEEEYILQSGSRWYVPESLDLIKSRLITNGPITFWIYKPEYGFNHAMSLIGYYTDDQNYINFIFKDSKFANYSPWVLCWNDIFKMIYVDPEPIITQDDPLPIRQVCDYDQDGYYNWGIGSIPEGWEPPCHSEDILEDWNDNKNRIGPCDEHFIEQAVQPEMQVTYRLLSDVPVNDNDIINISGNSSIDNYYTFKIRNSGDAQLNFQKISIPPPPHAYIDIDFQNHSGWFEYYEGDYLDTAVCMYSDDTFKIKLKSGAQPGDLAHVHIYVDELDIDDFEFTLVYNSCETQLGHEEINGEVNWTDPYYTKLKDIHIIEGGRLTITGTVILSPETDIFVDAGGKLIIDGGKLTSSCNSLWNGIDVWGNERFPQMSEYQGMVEIKNGGMIEYADTAITNARFINIYYYPTGGIVSCKDAVFKDNDYDVVFYPYTNTNPFTHEIIANASRLTRTKFETTDGFYEKTHSASEAHLKLNEVGGIRFAGCTFYNSSTQDDYSRGIGIESNDAGYTINNFCAEDIIPCPGEQPCLFENLDYGIRAFNNNDYFPILVDSADFIHDRRGMYLGLIDHATVVKNRFDLSDPAGIWINEPIIGLYLDEFTTGYVVEENQFFTNTTTSESFGIHLLNNGPEQNEIYNNSFSLLSKGIMAVGDNRMEDTGVGLCIKCNDFTDCIDDISVTPALDENEIPIITDNTGIALWQGEEGEGNDLAAGNTFSEYAEYNYINDEGCRKIDYTYHGHETSSNVYPEPTAGDIDKISDEDAEYSKEESCPSHLTGGGITLSQEKLLLTSETELISAYQDTLLAIVDGGNTEGLNYEVLTSYPEEALVIRQELIDESPFLSDTVMISAIEKEDVLPGAMIRDVLVQNPQAPKSTDVMNALNQRQDTIPGYMMEEIQEGLAVYGEKELLEQQMGQHIAKRDMAWRNLNHYLKGDTSNTGPYSDSLIALYENENRPEARYDLCFMHLSREDSSSLFNTLSDIPIEFDMSTDELFIHNQYQDLFGILWEVKIDSTGLDSLQMQSLYNLSTPIHSVPANYALNLLISKGLIGYNEPVYSVELLKSVTVPAQSPQVNESPDRLMAFPNPAGNYFIVQYDLTGFTGPGILAISDIKGLELKQYGLTDLKNQVVISTADYPSGNYIIHLIGGYKLVSSEKIFVIR